MKLIPALGQKNLRILDEAVYIASSNQLRLAYATSFQVLLGSV